MIYNLHAGTGLARTLYLRKVNKYRSYRTPAVKNVGFVPYRIVNRNTVRARKVAARRRKYAMRIRASKEKRTALSRLKNDATGAAALVKAQQAARRAHTLAVKAAARLLAYRQGDYTPRGYRPYMDTSGAPRKRGKSRDNKRAAKQVKRKLF